MVDFATIGSALTSIKTATEIAKMLKDSDVSLEKAETKLKLAELVEALADAKIKIAEIQEQLIEKNKKIKDLENDIGTHGKMIWRDPVYYMKKDGGEEGPYCPQCYDSGHKSIRLIKLTTGLWECKTCKNTYTDNTYRPPQKKKAIVKAVPERRRRW